MITIEIKQIKFPQEIDRFDAKNYTSGGVYLVNQEKPKGLGIAEIFLVSDKVIILPVDLINYIEKLPQIKPTEEKGLSESFVLELIKIINK